MLTKEKYLDILDKFEFFYGYNLKATSNRKVTEQVEKDRLDNFIRDLDCFRGLVYDHFQAKSLKFEDLKEGMWIYDAPYEEIVRIKEIESNEWIFLECIKSKDLSNTFFQEGRFYPITIPNIGDKNG